MINDVTTGESLKDRLDDLRDVLPNGRRLPPEELKALVRARCELSVLLGATSAGDEGHTPYANPTLGSASQISDAVLLSATAPGSTSWLTEAVGRDPARYVCFVFSLAMGNGSALPQPSVTFALDLEGREVARFCLVKRLARWVGRSAVFAFFPLRIDSVPFGRAFGVDDTIDQESTLADGYGLLFVDKDLVVPGRPNRLSVRTVRAADDRTSRHWVRVGITEPYFPVFFVESHLDALRAAAAPQRRARHGDFELLLGDLHSHSGESRFLDSSRPAREPRARAGPDPGNRCSSTPATSPAWTSSACPSTTGRWMTATGPTSRRSTTGT